MSLQFKTHSFNPVSWFGTVVLGVLLVALSARGLFSLFYALPASSFVENLNKPATIDHTLDEFDMSAQTLELAKQFEPERRQHHTDEATLLLRLYYKLKSIGRETEADGKLEKARQTIVDTLKRSPGDANLWYLLAEIRALQNKMDHITQRFLNMSYLTGPREGWIALRRLSFSLRYWLLLDRGLRHHVEKEITTLWSDRAYQRIMMQQLSHNTVRAQNIIFTQIKSLGDEDVQKFQTLAKRIGWHASVFKPLH